MLKTNKLEIIQLFVDNRQLTSNNEERIIRRKTKAKLSIKRARA